MTSTFPSQDLPQAVLPREPRKQPRPVRKIGTTQRPRRDCPLGQDLPLREGVVSLERWLDLSA